jgi:anti-sigma-K factor RskA
MKKSRRNRPALWKNASGWRWAFTLTLILTALSFFLAPPG